MALHIVSILALLATTVTAQDNPRWVWGHNENNILPSHPVIPGRVEPRTTGGAQIQPLVPTISKTETNIDSNNLNASKKPTRITSASRIQNNNPNLRNQNENIVTTKSRVVEDTLPVVNVVGGERYTTLDQLFKDRQNDPIVNHVKGDLGGLDPKEVFYADDNLLIIRGGGFPVSNSEDKLQPLDNKPISHDQPPIIPLQGPPPSHNEEYNGNIPSIVPPINHPGNSLQHLMNNVWKRNTGRPYNTGNGVRYFQYPGVYPVQSYPFVFGANYNHNVYITQKVPVPYVQERIIPHTPTAPIISLPKHQSINYPQSNYHGGQVISLHGDTDVNFLHPIPSLNPEAEIITRTEFEFSSHPEIPTLTHHRVKPIL